MNAPRIPREQWTHHPRFPRQTLLLGSHANFRAFSRHLVDLADAGESIVRIAALYGHWIAAMRSHEAYEERKLYPYLSRRWNVDFTAAKSGHEALHARDDAVREAFHQVEEDGRSEAVVQALLAHDATLDAHLALEEELVIPLLLELSPEEFDRYSRSPIEYLLSDLE